MQGLSGEGNSPKWRALAENHHLLHWGEKRRTAVEAAEAPLHFLTAFGKKWMWPLRLTCKCVAGGWFVSRGICAHVTTQGFPRKHGIVIRWCTACCSFKSTVVFIVVGGEKKTVLETCKTMRLSLVCVGPVLCYFYSVSLTVRLTPVQPLVKKGKWGRWKNTSFPRPAILSWTKGPSIDPGCHNWFDKGFYSNCLQCKRCIMQQHCSSVCALENGS